MDADVADRLKEPEFTFPLDAGEMVAREYARASSILEYGSGGSTVLAARSTEAEVLSIESDKAWADKLAAFLEQEKIGGDRVRLHWSNVGPTGKWGYPTDQSKWRKYPTYAFCPWEKFQVDPDVVLIDGRFRLACFAAVMMFAKRKTTVLFDDYGDRPHYHAAAEFVAPEVIRGRMAKFVIEPNPQRGEDFACMVRWFFAMK